MIAVSVYFYCLVKSWVFSLDVFAESTGFVELVLCLGIADAEIYCCIEIQFCLNHHHEPFVESAVNVGSNLFEVASCEHFVAFLVKPFEKVGA